MADENMKKEEDDMGAEECATIKDAFADIMDDLGDQFLDMAFGAVVGKVMEKVKVLSVTNRRVSSVTGERGMHPTKDDASLQKGEANTTRNNAALAKDDVCAQKGTVGAAQTDAKANISEATASEAGATAVRTKAGASDIETKALKMM